MAKVTLLRKTERDAGSIRYEQKHCEKIGELWTNEALAMV
jgi:hypothetical protein